MNHQLLASYVLAAMTGVASAAAATSGDEGNRAKPNPLTCHEASKSGSCPAETLIEKWESAAERIAALPAQTRETVAAARATLSASCPVCQEAPASFAFLGRFLDATVALDDRLLAYGAKECGETPEEIRDAFAQRVAIGAKGRELLAAFGRSMASLEGPPKAGTEAATEPPLARAAEEFEAIHGEAGRLATRWSGVPARAASLSPEKKSELFEAMAVFRRELNTCELANETFAVLEEGLDRLVALDRTLAAHCAASSSRATEALPAEFAELKKAVDARSGATAEALRLLRVMRQSMSPEIFDGRKGTASGR